MASKMSCKSLDELKKFALGELSPEDAAQCERHLDHCSLCAVRLRSLQRRDAHPLKIKQDTHSPAKRSTDHALTFASSPFGSITTQEAETLAEIESLDIDQELTFLGPSRQPDELGRLDQYRVLRVLGSGGMGIVFEAEELQLKRRVALKVMRPSLARRRSCRRRFLLEAQATASLKNEHVVAVYEVRQGHGIPFIAMELLRGQSLEDRLNITTTFAESMVIAIARQTALGLHKAHSKGLIHRDIKPGNIWLQTTETGEPFVKILDFGLARVVSDDVQLTKSGVVIGTPAFMAPEQARALPVDARCDLFSLGAVMYRMTTGRLPFAGEDTLSMLMALANDDPPPPHELNPEVSRELSRFIMKLLRKDPDERPASAKHVFEYLDRWNRPNDSGLTTSEEIDQLPSTLDLKNPPRPARKRRWLAWTVMVAFALAVGLFAASRFLPNSKPVTQKRRKAEPKPPPKVFTESERDAAGRLLAQGNALTILQRGEAKVIESSRQLPTDSFQVVRLTLDRGVFDELGLAPVAALRRLFELNLTGLPVAGGALKNIADLDKLQRLDLTGTGITDDDLRFLENLTEMQTLILYQTRVRGPGLAHLKRMRKMQKLLLGSGTPIVDEGLEYLQALPRLERLELGEYVTDHGLKAVGKITTLRGLRFDSPNITNEGMKHLTGLGNLEYLSTYRTQVTGPGLETLTVLPRLADLGMGYTRMTDSDLKPLAKFRYLKSISLRNCPISDDGIDDLASVSTLRKLDLRGTNVTPAGVKRLKAKLKDCSVASGR